MSEVLSREADKRRLRRTAIKQNDITRSMVIGESPAKQDNTSKPKRTCLHAEAAKRMGVRVDQLGKNQPTKPKSPKGGMSKPKTAKSIIKGFAGDQSNIARLKRRAAETRQQNIYRGLGKPGQTIHDAPIKGGMSKPKGGPIRSTAPAPFPGGKLPKEGSSFEKFIKGLKGPTGKALSRKAIKMLLTRGRAK